jgi:hypothetical protein
MVDDWNYQTRFNNGNGLRSRSQRSILSSAIAILAIAPILTAPLSTQAKPSEGAIVHSFSAPQSITGSTAKSLAQGQPAAKTAALPKVVIEQLRQDVRQYEPNALKDNFKITNVQSRRFNSCLNLPKWQEVCSAKASTQGWRVQFTFNSKTWIYHTSRDRGSRLNLVETLGKPPQPAIAKAAQDAANRSQTSAKDWQVVETKPLSWPLCSGSPEGPTQPIRGAMCVGPAVLGWRLKLKNRGQTWVYYAPRYDQVQQIEFTLDDTQSVPSALLQQVIQAAQRESQDPKQSFRLFEAKQLTWKDSCLGITHTKPACKMTPVPGWSISVMSSQSMLWNFHTGLERDVRFNSSGRWMPPP